MELTHHHYFEFSCWSCVYTHFLLLCQKMSFGRTQQLQDLQQIIQEISKEIMWVNDREEEELMFDWGDKNIDQYIPRKQESYSVSKMIESSVRTRRHTGSF